MADSTTASRPRPRPRPRPLVKSSSIIDGPYPTPGASSSSSTSIPLASSSSPGKKRVIEVHDTDEMFMRNTNRTYQTWQRLDKIDKQMSKEAAASSDGDSDNATPSPKRNHKKKKSNQEFPSWQRSKAMSRFLSQDISENDSDDDIEILGESTPNAKLNGKRKRQERSRSRSITPPPSVPLHQIQTAKNLVRQALNIVPRPPSPKFDPDDSTDTIVLLPELSAIAQQIKDKHHLYSSPAPEAPVSGSGEHIVVNVTWHPHPKALEAQKQDWQYRIDRTESFRNLFEAVAEDAGIPSGNVVMTYQNNRFFPSITAMTLKIWSDSASLDAYEQTTWKYIQESQEAARFTTSQATTSKSTSINTNGPIEIDSDSDNDDDIQILGTSTFTTSGPMTASPSPPPTYTQPHESDAESEAEVGGKLKLILRSSLTNKDIALTVRSTTKCGAIVKAFLKKAGLADKYPEVFSDAPAAPPAAPEPKKRGRKSKGAIAAAAAAAAAAAIPPKDPRLCIDGDKMENATEIGEMDLEDGDMVEVVGL